MQIEIYCFTAKERSISAELMAVCDSFSSLLWDVEYYECGCFEVYIAANAKNVEIFRTGRIIGRNDDKEHFGIIESVQIDTDAENGDYLTVSGRFLTLKLSIILDTFFSKILTKQQRIIQHRTSAVSLQVEAHR